MNKQVLELKKISIKQLLIKLIEKRQELDQKNFDNQLQKLKDTSQICKTKKEVAQILTVLNDKIRQEREEEQLWDN